MNEHEVKDISLRIAGSVSLCCALIIIRSVSRSRYYRGRIYHRIMFGCSVNVAASSVHYIWGNTAVPRDTDGVPWAKGNITTCNISGFLWMWSSLAPPFYYNALSVLSFVSIKNRFKLIKYGWIEKWIHILVHIPPLVVCLHLLLVDAFNPAPFVCGVASLPNECGDQSDKNIECTRGPSNIGFIGQCYIGLGLFLLVFPTVMMLASYVVVRRRGKIVELWKTVAKQGVLYLLPLYLSYGLLLIDLVAWAVFNKSVFLLTLSGQVVQALLGLWVMLIYNYFRSDNPDRTISPTPRLEERNSKSGDNVFTNETDKECSNINNISSLEKIDNNIRQPPESSDAGSVSVKSAGSRLFSRYTSIKKPEFSIFDGGNIATDSPWAAFIEEGEDSDYEEENCDYSDGDFYNNIDSDKE